MYTNEQLIDYFEYVSGPNYRNVKIDCVSCSTNGLVYVRYHHTWSDFNVIHTVHRTYDSKNIDKFLLKVRREKLNKLKQKIHEL